jgi:hypothetical protein
MAQTYQASLVGQYERAAASWRHAAWLMEQAVLCAGNGDSSGAAALAQDALAQAGQAQSHAAQARWLYAAGMRVQKGEPHDEPQHREQEESVGGRMP